MQLKNWLIGVYNLIGKKIDYPENGRNGRNSQTVRDFRKAFNATTIDFFARPSGKKSRFNVRVSNLILFK